MYKMKNIFQLPILILMLLASGYTYATSVCSTLAGGDIEAYVKNACSESSNDGGIDLSINGDFAPWEITYFLNNEQLGPPEVTDQGTVSRTDLKIGFYRIEVIDSHCAKATLEVTVGLIRLLIFLPSNHLIWPRGCTLKCNKWL